MLNPICGYGLSTYVEGLHTGGSDFWKDELPVSQVGLAVGYMD